MLIDSHHVYIAKDGTIFDANLNQTDLATNANKFYRIQVWTEVNMYCYIFCS